MTETTNRVEDLWTESPSYRRCYQSDDEVETTLALLDLAGARGLEELLGQGRRNQERRMRSLICPRR